MKINSIRNLKSLKDKKVLLRVDFNVPIENGKIKDDYRIVSGLETIKYLLDKKAKIIIIGHLGDPKNSNDKNCSLKPVALRLKKLLNMSVKFIPAIEPEKISAALSKSSGDEIVFLENLRFNSGEKSNDIKFAKFLASLADIYVNDAFSVCHRKQASISAITKYITSYAGLLLERELIALNKVLKPKKPMIAVMGGAKISTKAPLITKLHGQAEKILIGGALATSIVKFLGYEVGKSFCDDKIGSSLEKKIKNTQFLKKIVLPVDFAVKDKDGAIRICRPDEIKKNESILDIGPDTIGIFDNYIKHAATIVWNGPMGKFEESPFKQGSLSLARSIASRSKGRAFGLVGGGESVEVLKMSKMDSYIDFISTAGGAMLSFLGGEKLPGLKAIIK